MMTIELFYKNRTRLQKDIHVPQPKEPHKYITFKELLQAEANAKKNPLISNYSSLKDLQLKEGDKKPLSACFSLFFPCLHHKKETVITNTIIATPVEQEEFIYLHQ